MPSHQPWRARCSPPAAVEAVVAEAVAVPEQPPVQVAAALPATAPRMRPEALAAVVAPASNALEQQVEAIEVSLSAPQTVAAIATPEVAAEEPAPEVITRVSTSGGRHWGVNVGRYASQYEAERALVRVALSEMQTLDGSLRRVSRSPRGFDANFMGLTRETADLACRRLQARGITCFMIGQE